MSVQAISAAFAVQGVSPSEKLVLLALANYADAEGKCWPSQARLALDTGLTDRQIRRVFVSLIEAGLMTKKERRRPDGYRASDVITLTLSPDTMSASEEPHRTFGDDLTGHLSPISPDTVSGLTTLEPSENHQRDVVVERERVSDWPETRIVDALVAEVGSPWLDPAKTPGLITTAGSLARWRAAGAGWERDVLPVIRGACAKRRSPVGSWSYFDAAISQAIADNTREMTIPEARAGPTVVSLTDRIAAEHAEARRLAFARLEAKRG